MMKLSLSVKTILFTVVCFAVFNSSAYAKTMYKWVDEHGKVSFSDQVPPTKASLGHEELDKNANVVRVSEKAKTKAELEIQKRLILLRKQQEQIILKQKARDKKLLSSFLNVTAMDTTQKSKLQALAGQNMEMLASIKEMEKDLTSKQQEAASFEIKNTKVPKGVLDQIEELQKKILKTKQDIKELELKKSTIEKEFAVDRSRYLFLTQSKTNTSSSASEKETASAGQPGLFSCADAAQCDKAWSIATEFVKSNSTAKIAVDSDTLFMSEDPILDTDLNLSVSKMTTEGNKTEIFLDIRCANSPSAKALCDSSKAQDIRIRFNDFIKAKLTATTTPAPASTPAKK